MWLYAWYLVKWAYILSAKVFLSVFPPFSVSFASEKSSKKYCVVSFFFLMKLLCVLIPLTCKAFSCLGRGHFYFLTSQNGETGSRHLSGDTQGEQRVHEGWDVAGRLS